MYGLYAVMIIASLGIVAGAFYRLSAIAFFFSFTYVELIDVTNYLNHYYLVSLLSFLICFLPLNRRFSIDALIGVTREETRIDPAVLYLLRFQVAIVYLFAAIAKFTSDWLLHAQPLGIWLRARVDVPVIGSLFEYRETAYVMSWAGFLFDATIVFWLLNKRTRIPAYIVLIVFHLFTGVLFKIGMFPWIMMACATLFFAPDWCARLFPVRHRSSTYFRVPTVILAAILIWCAFHVLFPLRTFVSDHNVLWTEQGMRWSWRVMVREKKGAVSYRVVDRETGKSTRVAPTTLLTKHQTQEMSGQPDLIARLGRDIGIRTGRDVEVYVDAMVSLNGRPPQAIVDPTVDLVTLTDPWTLSPPDWILDAPVTSPR